MCVEFLVRKLDKATGREQEDHPASRGSIVLSGNHGDGPPQPSYSPITLQNSQETSKNHLTRGNNHNLS